MSGKKRGLSSGMVVLLVAAAGGLLPACGSGGGDSVPGRVPDRAVNPLAGRKDAVEEGRRLYTYHCLNCHGENGKGDGISGASLVKKPADLTSQGVSGLPDGRIFLTVVEGKMVDGKMTMPPARRVTDEEVWKIVAFVRTLQAKR